MADRIPTDDPDPPRPSLPPDKSPEPPEPTEPTEPPGSPESPGSPGPIESVESVESPESPAPPEPPELPGSPETPETSGEHGARWFVGLVGVAGTVSGAFGVLMQALPGLNPDVTGLPLLLGAGVGALASAVAVTAALRERPFSAVVAGGVVATLVLAWAVLGTVPATSADDDERADRDDPTEEATDPDDRDRPGSSSTSTTAPGDTTTTAADAGRGGGAPPDGPVPTSDDGGDPEPATVPTTSTTAPREVPQPPIPPPPSCAQLATAASVRTVPGGGSPGNALADVSYELQPGVRLWMAVAGRVSGPIPSSLAVHVFRNEDPGSASSTDPPVGGRPNYYMSPEFPPNADGCFGHGLRTLAYPCASGLHFRYRVALVDRGEANRLASDQTATTHGFSPDRIDGNLGIRFLGEWDVPTAPIPNCQ